MGSKDKERVALDTRTWISLLGLILMVILAVAGLMSFIFWPRAEGQAEVTRVERKAEKDLDAHRMQPAHSVQMEINKQHKEDMVEQKELLHTIKDAVTGVKAEMKYFRRYNNHRRGGLD